MVDVTVQVILWSSSELALSSICICTPSLRTVWRNYVASGSRSAATRGYRLEEMSKNVDETNGYSVRVGRNGRSKGFSTENDSDENILRHDDGHSGIKLTQEVQVSYAGDRDGSHSFV